MRTRKNTRGRATIGGIAGWLIAKFRDRKSAESRLALIDRIVLGPRQSLALVEAEGHRILVATSAEGGPAFFALSGRNRSEASQRSSVARSRRTDSRTTQRVSW